MMTNRVLRNSFSRKVTSTILLSGLLLLPLERLYIGPAQIVQIWCVVVICALFGLGKLRSSLAEAAVFVTYSCVALLMTFGTEYARIKEIDQVVKFLIIYPAFYLVGRWLGQQYVKTELPYGLVFICLMAVAQIAVQMLEIPVIFEDVKFMRGVLYGSFKERNWLSVYLFFLLYIYFLRGNKERREVAVFGIAAALVGAGTGSKMILPCTGIAVLFNLQGRWLMKSIFVAVGAVSYLLWFSVELSGDSISFRMEHERGLALKMGLEIVQEDWLGHGFGYVEEYFAKSAVDVQGLGEGVNAIFCTPVDLVIVAGVAGLAFWGMFMAGIGVYSVRLLAPVAVWSLFNPLHESEIVYLFVGLIISWGIEERSSRDKLRSGAKGLAGAT